MSLKTQNSVNLNGWTVLIVDDDQDNLTVASKLLEFYGAAVHTASSAERGLVLLETLQPTLILSDISMPAMDGYALLGAIRSRPALQGVPVVALTANAMIGDEDSIRNSGFDGYIGKPFSLTTFVSEITKVVAQLNTAGESETS